MTVNCARCHNHKFDPILQADFYRLQAVFAGAKGKDVEIATPAEKSRMGSARSRLQEANLQPVEEALKELAKPYAEKIKRRTQGQARACAPRGAGHFRRRSERRNSRALAKNAEAQIKPTWDEVVAIMPRRCEGTRAKLREQLHEIEFTAPDPMPTAYAFVNTGKDAPQSYVLRMGDPHSSSTRWIRPSRACSRPATRSRTRDRTPHRAGQLAGFAARIRSPRA